MVSMANCAPRQSVSPSAHNLESSSVECVEVAQVHVANKHVGRDPCPCFATHLCSSAFQSTPSAFPRPLPHGTPRDDGQKNQVGGHIGRSARKGEGKTGDDDRAGSGTAVPRSLSFWRSGGRKQAAHVGISTQSASWIVQRWPHLFVDELLLHLTARPCAANPPWVGLVRSFPPEQGTLTTLPTMASPTQPQRATVDTLGLTRNMDQRHLPSLSS